MNVLLTGGNGQVGWELARVLAPLADVTATDRTTLDLRNPDSLRRRVRDAKPNVIINAAAYTAVDRAESERELAEQVNAVAPGILAEEAKRLGSLLVHYSTDYIFDGTKRAPYLEGDLPNPLNVYGRTKLEGDKRVASSGCRHLILRTSWVYGPRGRNFFLAIAKKAMAGEALRVVSDQHGVPSESRFIAQVTSSLIERNLEGTFNLVPSGQTTWYGLARRIALTLGAHVDIEPISSAEYTSAARRPAYSVLDCSKLSSEIGQPMVWELLVDECAARWNNTQTVTG